VPLDEEEAEKVVDSIKVRGVEVETAEAVSYAPW